jgi:5,10-methenyltetrahydrofolate synthetase
MSAEKLNWTDKSSLRDWAKSQDPDVVSFQTTYLKKFISEFINPGETWGAFQPIQNEPNIDWSIFKDMGFDLCFPKVVGSDLKFYKAAAFQKGSYGINEPVNEAQNLEVLPEQISGLFIPGLAFDNRGRRLGRGKSYYDRYLKNFLGLKVGLTWNKYFIQGSIPTDAWDVPMNFILTENFIYQPLTSTNKINK